MLKDQLQKHFGFTSFLKGQEEVIRKVLARQSAAAIFPTGAGKSLCYQLPAMVLPGITLVVSPLLSLMKDQLDFLLSNNIPAETENLPCAKYWPTGTTFMYWKILFTAIRRKSHRSINC